MNQSYCVKLNIFCEISNETFFRVIWLVYQTECTLFALFVCLFYFELLVVMLPIDVGVRRLVKEIYICLLSQGLTASRGNSIERNLSHQKPPKCILAEAAYSCLVVVA